MSPYKTYKDKAPSTLYHGSNLAAMCIKPDFDISKKLIDYGHGESNRFVYASSNEREAELQGVIATLGNYLEIVNYNAKLDNPAPIIYIKILNDVALKRDSLLMDTFTTYRIETKDSENWTKVKNTLNRYRHFYRTSQHIKSNIMGISTCYLLDWLEDIKVEIETPKMLRTL